MFTLVLIPLVMIALVLIALMLIPLVMIALVCACIAQEFATAPKNSTDISARSANFCTSAHCCHKIRRHDLRTFSADLSEAKKQNLQI